jgi:hypothetical protein
MTRSRCAHQLCAFAALFASAAAGNQCHVHQERTAASVDGLRLLWGTLLLLRSAPLLRAAGHEPTTTAVTTARVLGARHLVQAAAFIGSRQPALLRSRLSQLLRRAGAGADALHALSALGFAAAGLARPAWTADAAVASAIGTATWLTADA